MEDIKIRMKDGKIEASIPWNNGEGPIAAKSVPGYRFHRETKTWTYPLELRAAKGLHKAAKEMGVSLLMSDGIRAWGRAESQRVAAMVDPNSQKLVDLPIIRTNHPAMWKALSGRPFQTVGVKFAMERKRYLLGDDPGLGKTLQTIGTMIESQMSGPILVVGNKSAVNISWPNEIRKWAPQDKVIVFGTNIPKAQREDTIRKWVDWSLENGERVWICMNPHWVRMKAELDQYGKYVRNEKGIKIVRAEVPELFKHQWAAIVADESQETLATNTGNAKKWSQQRLGLGGLPLAENGFKISISGTPMRGKPENMYGQVQWLYPERYTSYWNWAEENFEIDTEEFYVKGGRGAKEEAKRIGAIKSEKIFYDNMKDFFIRRSKAEVASDLPPKQYAGTPHPEGDVVGVWLPMEKTQKKLYDNFVNDFSLEAENGLVINAVSILPQLTRMKQLATTSATIGLRPAKVPLLDENGSKVKVNGKVQYERDPATGEYILVDETYLIPELPSNKYDWLKEWLLERDLLGAGSKGKSKVLIASQFRGYLDLIRDDLGQQGTPSFAVTGATTAKQRVDQQDAFQNDPDSPKLFFLQSVAGGTSITLDMADDVIIMDEMWNPDTQQQIEDRAHRLSRSHNVNIWYLRSLDTIEEMIGTRVAERERVTRAIMDGSRGVELVKQLLGR